MKNHEKPSQTDFPDYYDTTVRRTLWEGPDRDQIEEMGGDPMRERTLGSPKGSHEGNSWEPKGSHGRNPGPPMEGEPLGAQGIPWEGTLGGPSGILF